MRFFGNSIYFLFISVVLSFNLFAQSGSNEFYNAIKRGDLQKVKEFVCKEGKDVIFPPDFSARLDMQPIHVAAYFGKLDIVKYLIEEKGIKVDVKTGYDENTALHYASEVGHVHIIKYLIKKKANIREKSSFGEGKTAFLLSCDSGKIEAVKALLAAGADIHEAKDNCIGIAVRTQNIDLLKFFIKNGADMNSEGFIIGPLFYAYNKKKLNLVRYLIERGVLVREMDLREINISDTTSTIKSYLEITDLFDKSTDKIGFIQKALEEKKGKVCVEDIVNLLLKRSIHTLGSRTASLCNSYCKLCIDLSHKYKKNRTFKKAIGKTLKLDEKFEDKHFFNALIKIVNEVCFRVQKAMKIEKLFILFKVGKEFKNKLFSQIVKKKHIGPVKPDILVKCVNK